MYTSPKNWHFNLDGKKNLVFLPCHSNCFIFKIKKKKSDICVRPCTRVRVYVCARVYARARTHLFVCFWELYSRVYGWVHVNTDYNTYCELTLLCASWSESNPTFSNSFSQLTIPSITHWYLHKYSSFLARVPHGESQRGSFQSLLEL